MLLGLKGTLAEAELHLIRARLDGGLRHKAARGELELSLPVGLDRGEGGRIGLSADEQVRHAIGRVFELWRRLGSARQVVICLRDEDQRLPRRTVGQRRVRWMPASYRAVHAFLTNPTYAGAFVFGRTTQRREFNEQGRRTGTGLPFSQSRVKYVRQQHGIPAAPPPDPDSGLVTIQQAARELGVSNATVYRWLSAGLLPGEQTTPHAPWRIRLTDDSRTRFVPAVPDGYLPLDEAAKRLSCARQTVLHKVQRGELDAVQVINGRRKGLRIKVTGPEAGLFEK